MSEMSEDQDYEEHDSGMFESSEVEEKDLVGDADVIMEDDYEVDEDDYEDDYDDDDEDEDEDEDLGFSAVLDSEKRKKVFETEHSVHSTQDIVQWQQRETSQVASLLGCLPEHAAMLLRFFRWKKDRLIERYMDDPSKILAEAGVIIDEHELPKLVTVPNFECAICCNDDAEMETLALSCGHRFCKDCYRHYLTVKIAEEGESRRIQCMEDGCNVVVDENTVRLLVPEDIRQKYQNLLNRTFVDDSDFLKWCPAPDCEYAVECHVSNSQLLEIVPTVTCKCSKVFCFGCSYDDHQPCICKLAQLWLKKCQDDSETANWMAANTKLCTKCHSTIEKNGGCNHMTCRKCKYEFCWVCLGPWSEHGTSYYNCNRFEEKSSLDARSEQAKSRAALERYLHYYNRYANHQQSARLSQEFYQNTEKKMEELQNTTSMSWIEVQFMKKAVEVTLEARQTLKWTYAFAYYLERNNSTHLFEDNQRDLEIAVESLNQLLERPVDENTDMKDLKLSVLDKMNYVKTRREVMLTDTLKGLQESMGFSSESFGLMT